MCILSPGGSEQEEQSRVCGRHHPLNQAIGAVTFRGFGVLFAFANVWDNLLEGLPGYVSGKQLGSPDLEYKEQHSIICVCEGKISEVWKTAVISPLFKGKGSKNAVTSIKG